MSNNHDLYNPPELVVFDLDNTAIASDENATMSAALISAIALAHDAGILLSVATGRSWQHFSSAVQNVREHLAPCIISGGSQIVTATNGTILWEVCLLQAHIRALNAVAVLYDKRLSYNDGLKVYGPCVDITTTGHTTIAYVLDITQTELDPIMRKLSAISDLNVVVTQSWGVTGRFDLHVTHSIANKGTALQKLASLLDVPVQAVAAVGDGLNDIPMFEVAGMGYAIKNSVAQERQSSLGVIGPVIDDGLAKFIMKLHNKLK